MAEPGDNTAAAGGRGDFRASRADRERAIEVLKTAFVEERLTKDEFDVRVAQALASRTYAELAAVTSDLHTWPVAAGPTAARPAAARPPSTPARILATAAGRSGVCVLAAFAVVGLVAVTHAEGFAVFLALAGVVTAVIAASGFLGYGVLDAWQEHRSRRQLPPQPGRNGGGLEGGRPGSAGRDPALPGPPPDQTRPDQIRVDLPTHRPGRDRWSPSGRDSRTPRGTRLVPNAV